MNGNLERPQDTWPDDEPFRDDLGATGALACTCTERSWVQLADGTWRCRACHAPLPDRLRTPLVSACCGDRLIHDSTRTFCAACGRLLHDLNSPDAYDRHMVACPDCGGNGRAGGIDDLYCPNCAGEGLLET